MAKVNYQVAGLDIGSAKTTVCVGHLDPLGRVEIRNAVIVKTRGIEHGVITDLGEAAGCIEEAVRKAEGKFQGSRRIKAHAGKKNIKIHSVYTTISGEHVLGNNTKGMLNLAHRPVEIRRKDTQRAVDSAKYLATSIDREILHALAQEFVVDGYKRIKDPQGIFGARLGVNLHIISCGLSFVTNVVKAINRAGLDVDGMVYSGLATSLATLTEQEKQSGVILLEFGAGTVNILFFNEGSLQYTSVIPIGGQDITLEIARTLGIDAAQAEELKMQYKNVNSDYTSMKDKGDDKIIIRKNSAHYESITRKELAQIVDRKMDELLELIKKDLELAGIIWRVNCGIVVCGGMSFMDGIIEKIEHTIQLPTSLGIMRGFVSNFLGLSNIFYATSIGVVIHALHEKAQPGKGSMLQGTGVWGRMRAKMRNVYDEYF